MPSVGKAAQTVHSASRLKDCLHASIVTMLPSPGKTMAEFSGG
jgi:hypothetical protein